MNTKSLAVAASLFVVGSVLALSLYSDSPQRVLLTVDNCTVYFGGLDVEDGLMVQRIGSLRVVAKEQNVLSVACRVLGDEGLVLAQGRQEASGAPATELLLPPMRPSQPFEISPAVHMELVVVMPDGPRTWRRTLLASDAN